MPTPDPTLRPKAELGVVDRDGRVMLLDLDRLTEPPIVLTGTAADIWRLLDGRTPLSAIAARLAQEYAAPAGEILGGVQAYVDDLLARGLVEPVS